MKVQNSLISIITTLEIVYILYTFWCMKTKYFIPHPFSVLKCFEISLRNNIKTFFKHPIRQTIPSNYICPFGKYMSIILCIYLTIYRFVYDSKYTTLHKMVLGITFILSWMNMNALVYLLPFFIIEILILYLS